MPAAPAVAAERTERLSVSAVVEGGCGLIVPRQPGQMQAGTVCAAASRAAAPPRPIVTLIREPGADSAVLLVEF